MKFNPERLLIPPQTAESKQAEKLVALCKASLSFSANLDLDQTVSRIATEAPALLGFASAIVLLLDDTSEHLEVQAVSSLYTRDRSGANDQRLPTGDHRVVGLLGLTGPSYYSPSEVPEVLHPFLLTWYDSPPDTLLIPLGGDASSSGLIILAERAEPSAPGEFETELSSLLGAHAAASIRNARSVRTINTQLFEVVARGKREWEQTFDSISDAIFISNTDHILIRANKAFVGFFGKHPREIIGRKCYELIWANKQPCIQCPLDIMRLQPELPPATTSLECVMQGVVSQLTAYPMIDPRGRTSAIVHVVKDLTEQKRMQDLIIRAEKLRAVGEMASGIAHDFNNVLASIIGWNEIMLLSDLPAQLKECASAIHQAAVDGTETVKRIQEYTRIRKDTEFETVSIKEIVQGAIELSRPRWKDWAEKAGITINLIAEFAEIPPARGNASDLREVFLNIVLNAIDAMPEGGEIRIRTGEIGGNVFASIEDSGLGMPEDVQRRVFDPFFTTKGSGGSGLGLSVAYGIVSRHGGELTVKSTPGGGSIFTVWLPAASCLEQVTDFQEPYPSRLCRVLLIDDDERVLRAIGAMLKSEGHSVRICLGGKEAISAFGQGQYDLVVTDLGMPEVNGWEVAARVKAISPETPVVFLTGWGAEIATERLSELGVDAIIQKPCQLALLRQTINQVLSRDKIAKESSLPAEESPPGANGVLNILVIEDNRWFGDALRERLEIDGHLVKLTTTGQAGLRALEDQGFDLILSDLKLPDMSGMEIARRTRQARARPFMTIMTGDIGAVDRMLLQEDCVGAILRKPWKESELQRVLDEATRRQR